MNLEHERDYFDEQVHIMDTIKYKIPKVKYISNAELTSQVNLEYRNSNNGKFCQVSYDLQLNCRDFACLKFI